MNSLPSFYLLRNQLLGGVCQHELAVTMEGEGGQRGKNPTHFVSFHISLFAGFWGVI